MSRAVRGVERAVYGRERAGERRADEDDLSSGLQRAR